MNLPTTINVTRRREDTYAERFGINVDATTATFSLSVEGLGVVAGSVVSLTTNTKVRGVLYEVLTTIEFPITLSAIYHGAVATYDYEIVMTENTGLTRTIIEGSWTITPRKVT